jgi:ABC-2 type transport system ATP-binding protein
MSELFQRHRITGFRANSDVTMPEGWQDRVNVTCDPTGNRFRCRIDTAGSLTELLPWLHSLQLDQLRIEPLGLRAVYDSVHFGTDLSGMEDEA